MKYFLAMITSNHYQKVSWVIFSLYNLKLRLFNKISSSISDAIDSVIWKICKINNHLFSICCFRKQFYWVDGVGFRMQCCLPNSVIHFFLNVSQGVVPLENFFKVVVLGVFSFTFSKIVRKSKLTGKFWFLLLNLGIHFSKNKIILCSQLFVYFLARSNYVLNTVGSLLGMKSW